MARDGVRNGTSGEGGVGAQGGGQAASDDPVDEVTDLTVTGRDLGAAEAAAAAPQVRIFVPLSHSRTRDRQHSYDRTPAQAEPGAMEASEPLGSREGTRARRSPRARARTRFACVSQLVLTL